MTSIRHALQRSGELKPGSDSARLDTELLLASALGKPRTYLYTWPEQDLDPEQLARFDDFMRRRLAGEPVAYITGQRAFWSFDLMVSPAVLVPRPETELLVEVALQHLEDHDLQAQPLRIADLGTGSGAIALALATERPQAQLVAVDRSQQALDVARANATRLGLERIEFRRGDWCQALPEGLFDMIVSNPPYIEAGDPHLQQGDLRFEPTEALLAAEQGLADIIRICEQARRHLREGGMLLLEHGFEQAGQVRRILQDCQYQEVSTWRDLAGHERVSGGRWLGPARAQARSGGGHA